MREILDPNKLKYKQGYLNGCKDAILIQSEVKECTVDYTDDTPYALGYSEGYVMMALTLQEVSKQQAKHMMRLSLCKIVAEATSERHYYQMLDEKSKYKNKKMH